MEMNRLIDATLVVIILLGFGMIFAMTLDSDLKTEKAKKEKCESIEGELSISGNICYVKGKAYDVVPLKGHRFALVERGETR